MVNRLFAAGLLVRQIAPDHELGGFVAIAELDDTPPKLVLLPVVGWALAHELDETDGALSAILLVTHGPAGDFEFWDVDGAHGEAFLGIVADTEPATVARLHEMATTRLEQMKDRSRKAEEALNGPRGYNPQERTVDGIPLSELLARAKS
jgi:hypothetical protein